MKLKLPIVFCSLLAFAAPQAGAADITEGSILALDRKARTMVLSDRSVWPLDGLKTPLAADLKAGDRVRISYESSEDGVGVINEIQLTSVKQPAATATSSATADADISSGTVYAFDRKANIIVLTDRTVWSLDAMKTAAPAGLKAGVRVRIRYQSDEDGVSAINGIDILGN